MFRTRRKRAVVHQSRRKMMRRWRHPSCLLPVRTASQKTQSDLTGDLEADHHVTESHAASQTAGEDISHAARKRDEAHAVVLVISGKSARAVVTATVPRDGGRRHDTGILASDLTNANDHAVDLRPTAETEGQVAVAQIFRVTEEVGGEEVGGEEVEGVGETVRRAVTGGGLAVLHHQRAAAEASR